MTTIYPSDPYVQPAEAEQARKARGLWAWSILDGILMLVLTIALSLPLLGYFLYVDGVFNSGIGSPAFNDALRTTADTIQKQPGRFFAAFAVQELAFVLPVLLRVVALRRLPLSWLGLTFERFGRNIGFGVVLGLIAFGCNLILSQLFDRLGQHPDQAANLFPAIQPGSYGVQALIFLAVAIIAPIVEELVFRGYIFTAWYERWGAPVAYLVSALVFAVPHVAEVTQGRVALLVPIFVIGLLLAWGYHRTRSLVPNIVAHMINNGVGAVALLICINVGNANCTK
ncbi:MAG: CPBP family intramembrane metalloprotease [Herpetosiphonaceae bacterium]|nr:CPBP family intramembrane metalloprotease [Herpetosiphonaceae bacterium]